MSINEPFNPFEDNEKFTNQEKEILRNLELTEFNVKERAYGYDVVKTGIKIVESNLEIIDDFNEKMSNTDKNTSIEKMEQNREADEELVENLNFQADQVSGFINMLKVKELDFPINEALKYTDAVSKQFKNNQKIKNEIEKINQVEEKLILHKEEIKEICTSIWMRLQVMELVNPSDKFLEFKNKFRDILQDIDFI